MWISVKERLPDNVDQLVLFGEWYPRWNMFINMYCNTWGKLRDVRSYDLERSYTHWCVIDNYPKDLKL